MSGNTARIHSLDVRLRCLHVTIRKSETKTEVVYTPIFNKEIFASDDRHHIAGYVTEFRIPADRPASRCRNRNGIEWKLEFKADIPEWPDINEKLKFLVYPEDQD